MKCDICRRVAIAEITVNIECLNLAKWPEEWLPIAGTQNSYGLCLGCLKTFVKEGESVAEKLNPDTVLDILGVKPRRTVPN